MDVDEDGGAGAANDCAGAANDGAGVLSAADEVEDGVVDVDVENSSDSEAAGADLLFCSKACVADPVCLSKLCLRFPYSKCSSLSLSRSRVCCSNFNSVRKNCSKRRLASSVRICWLS